MNYKTYRRTTTRQFQGKYVKALHDLANSVCAVKAGALLKIEDKYNGFDLAGDVCEHCGVKPRFRRVQHWQVSDVLSDVELNHIRRQRERERTAELASFVRGIMDGLQDYEEGNLIPWSQVKEALEKATETE